MSFTNYMENLVLDHLFGGPDFDRLASVYVGLSTTEPQEDGTGITEPPSTDGYARVEIVNDGAEQEWEDAMTHDDKGLKANSAAVEFPEATADWPEVTHFFLADAASGGNILGYGSLAEAATASTGQALKYEAGELKITMD